MKRFNRISRLLLLTAFGFLCSPTVKAQNIVASGVSVLTVEKMVRDYLFGGNKDVTIKNIKYTGGFGGIGAYTAVGTPFGTTEGLVLSTGSIYMVNGPYIHDTTSTAWNVNPDFDAERIAWGGEIPLPSPPNPPPPPKTIDPAVIEFDIATPGNGLTFNFQFGSYEYDDTLHTDTSISIARDFFAILVQGKGLGNGLDYVNLGTVTEFPPPPPPPADPIGPVEVPINSWSVNNGPQGNGPCMRCDKFFDNRTKSGGLYPFTSMPGFTGVFSKSINIIPCDTYHVKILITDVEHPFMDSHLFINIETLNPPVYQVVDRYKIGTASYPIDTVAFEDCDYAEIRIERYTNIGSPGSVNLWYTGTAVPGLDYKPLPATVNFAANQRVAIVPIYAKKTSGNVPNRTIIVNNANEVCGILKYYAKTYLLKKDILNFSLGPDTSLCEGQQITLNATNNPPAEYYVWQDAKSGPFYNVTQTGKYSVRARIGTCLRSDTININFKPLVKFTLGPDSSICFKDSLKLDPKLSLADTNIKYQWFDMTNKPTKTVGSTGNYHLKVTRLGCSTYDTMALTVKPLPAVVLGNDTAFCYQGNPNFTIIANTDPFNDLLWNTGSKNMSVNVSQSGKYWIRARNNGCNNYDTIQVTMTQTPPLNLRDTSLCENYALKLKAPPGFSYIWNTGSSDSTITVTTAGTFIVRAQNGVCVAFDTSVVTRKPSPKVNLGNDTALCKGEMIMLDATSPNVNYLWGGAGNGCGNKPQCAAYSTGNYIVTLTSQVNGCISKDTLYFLAKPLPDPKLGKDTSICYFSPVTLTAKGPYDSLMWFDGSKNASFVYDKPGSYWVKAYHNNCSNTDTVHATLSPNSPPLTVSKDTGFCKGNAIIYDVSCINCTYLWDDNYTLPIRTFKKGGEHVVTITNLKCTRRDTISIDEIIPASVFPKDTFMCFGQTLVLSNPIPGSTFKWFDNSTGNTKNVFVSGKYWAKVNNKGCQYTDTIAVEFVGDPVVDLGVDISTCSSEKLILDATNKGYTTYLWSTGATTPTLQVGGSGNIRVEVTRCGVTVADDINVDYLSKEMTFYVPNAFTPADENLLNDELKPRGKVKEPFTYRFSIYNKWGQKVFETNDFNKGWDGSSNGIKLPSDVYVWTIEAYSDCYAEPYHISEGNVTLLK